MPGRSSVGEGREVRVQRGDLAVGQVDRPTSCDLGHEAALQSVQRDTLAHQPAERVRQVGGRDPEVGRAVGLVDAVEVGLMALGAAGVGQVTPQGEGIGAGRGRTERSSCARSYSRTRRVRFGAISRSPSGRPSPADGEGSSPDSREAGSPRQLSPPVPSPRYRLSIIDYRLSIIDPRSALPRMAAAMNPANPSARLSKCSLNRASASYMSARPTCISGEHG
jgi:hypothetical protein